jgi:integrase
VDGKIRKSLKTDKKGLAQHRLKQYIKGKFGLGPEMTVKQYYTQWMEGKKHDPQLRPSLVESYKQHFTKYILPEFSANMLSNVSVSSLKAFVTKLLRSGLSQKTVRNIVDASFRRLWRDAMIEGIVESNPFALLQWQRQPRRKPDPFTVEQRDRIIKWWAENDFFFYPYVFFQFHTGCRPSETAGLIWQDIDLERGLLTINRSLVMGEEGATKTQGADRVIPIGPELVEVLKLLPSRPLGLDHVFVGKRGRPMTKKWAEHNWARCLEKLEIRHRKFLCTRHTFITEAVKSGQHLKRIADYCGTSVLMIEADYCARQAVNFDRTNLTQENLEPRKIKENLVAGPGFEPGTSRL